jgi:hypothetical protein
MFDIIFYLIGFIGFLFVIIRWKTLSKPSKRTVLRIAYFISFFGIIIRFLIDGYYSPSLITAFSFLFVGFIFSEIYNILYKGDDKQ